MPNGIKGPIDIILNATKYYRMRQNGNYVQPQDSVERLSHAHTPHGAETQLKKVAESGSPQTAQGPSQRTWLDLAHFSQYRDSAEERS